MDMAAGASVFICRQLVVTRQDEKMSARRRVVKLGARVYPPPAGGANQKPGSTGPPCKVKGFGKSFCLFPAKVFRQEGRNTVLA